MYTTRFVTNRQVSLPLEVIDKLELQDGDLIVFYRNQQGEICIKKEKQRETTADNQDVIYSEFREEIRRLRAEKRNLDQIGTDTEKD